MRELKEIRMMRRGLSMTQSQLAVVSGVSQSLIAKIESGNVDPTYGNAAKIFRALDSARERTELSARDVMKKDLQFVSPLSKVRDAIEKMRRFNISQLPVIRDGKPIGMVSESSLLQAVLENGTRERVSKFISDSPPVVSQSTSTTVVAGMLKFFPIVLVGEKGKLVGVIAKSDILSKMSS